jgi:hypothetical protein
MATTATAHKASQAPIRWASAQPSSQRSVTTNRAETPAASRTVARNWVNAAGAFAAEGKEGDGLSMAEVMVFILFSLTLNLLDLALLITKIKTAS